MTLTPDHIDALHECAEYRNIPLQTALDAGWTQWWAQVGAMTRAAADMAVWEVSHAIEHVFSTYEKEKLELRLIWRQPRDMDPEGVRAEMLVNGRFYAGPHHIEIDADLHGRMLATDEGKALDYLHHVASRSILSNRKLIVDRLNEAYPRAITHPRQAAAIRHEFAADVTARVERLLLDGQTPPATSPRRARRV